MTGKTDGALDRHKLLTQLVRNSSHSSPLAASELGRTSDLCFFVPVRQSFRGNVECWKDVSGMLDDQKGAGVLAGVQAFQCGTWCFFLSHICKLNLDLLTS